MRTVVCDNAANAVAGYVSYMKRFGLNRNQLINSKNSMLNNLKGFINRELFTKRDLNPEWRTFSWRDGYTPMTWYFKLYLHPQQQIVAIISFYGQEDESKVRENRRVVRITESELKEIIAESVKTVLKEVYEDNKLFGWNAVKRIKTAATPHELKLLKKSYDKYGEECASRGEIPNEAGFELWKINKELNHDGKGLLYPYYF